MPNFSSAGLPKEHDLPWGYEWLIPAEMMSLFNNKQKGIKECDITESSIFIKTCRARNWKIHRCVNKKRTCKHETVDKTGFSVVKGYLSFFCLFYNLHHWTLLCQMPWICILRGNIVVVLSKNRTLKSKRIFFVFKRTINTFNYYWCNKHYSFATMCSGSSVDAEGIKKQITWNYL